MAALYSNDLRYAAHASACQDEVSLYKHLVMPASCRAVGVHAAEGKLECAGLEHLLPRPHDTFTGMICVAYCSSGQPLADRGRVQAFSQPISCAVLADYLACRYTQ